MPANTPESLWKLDEGPGNTIRTFTETFTGPVKTLRKLARAGKWVLLDGQASDRSGETVGRGKRPKRLERGASCMGAPAAEGRMLHSRLAVTRTNVFQRNAAVKVPGLWRLCGVGWEVSLKTSFSHLWWKAVLLRVSTPSSLQSVVCTLCAADDWTPYWVFDVAASVTQRSDQRQRYITDLDQVGVRSEVYEDFLMCPRLHTISRSHSRMMK